MGDQMKRIPAWLKGGAFVLCVAALCAVVWLRSQNVGADRIGLGRNFDFNLERHMDVDPDLILYEEVDPVLPGMAKVTALAAGPDDRMYVGGEDEIVILSAAGGDASRIAVDGRVRCLAVADDKTLYAGVGNHVEVFGADGLSREAWAASSEDAIPASIAVGTHDVYVAEARKVEVLHYDRTGRIVKRIGDIVLFSSPHFDVAVDADEKLWLANPGGREIRRHNPDGTLDGKWGRPGRDLEGFSGCCNPVDLVIRKDGSIVTSEKNIVRVKVTSADGRLLGVVAGPRSFNEGITRLDLARDTKGRILVLDPVNRSVRVFVEKEG